MDRVQSSALASLTLALSRNGSRIIPLSLATQLSLPFGDLFTVMLASKRETAIRNFSHVLGRRPDDPVVQRTARECFRQFSRYVAETIHVQGWGTQNVVDRLDIEGAEHFDEAETHGRGIVFVSGHMGSTEVAAAMAVLRGYCISSVADPMKPDWLMEYLVLSRQRMGIDLLPANRSGVSLLRVLRRGGMAAFVIDAGIDRSAAVPVTFFGRETLFPDGPARLARLSGAPLVFGTAVRLPRGRYRAFVFPPLLPDGEADPSADARRLTQSLATTLESLVRRYPAQWYAFREVWPRPRSS